MQDENRTKEELLLELKELRENVAELEESKLQLVQAEEDLRESEKLNRLTLSNISDAVFITDNNGLFTFICPNVNVIFGYSFSEVEKMGRISKLLGAEDLFTQTELEHLGEIRNIERNITDKAGNVHYLLVNVKKVSIDGGRCLYSCRDVTERRTAEDILKKAHEELELKVKERTSELNEANLKLIEEIEGHKSAEEALRESELKLRLKLDSVFSPGVDLVDEELSNIIDAPTIQSLMDYFTELTGMPTAIKDKRGNVLTSTGWQDICAKFHRLNPDTKQVCIQTDEEDIRTAENLKPGEYRAYKCDNGLYDVFTPLFIADKLVGNIYTGQILFDDEEVDESFYAERADKYGFNKKEYLEAFRRVPRVSRDKVEKTMKYLAKITEFISRISYSNLMMVKTLSEKEITEKELKKSEEKYRSVIENIQDVFYRSDAKNNLIMASLSIINLLGYDSLDECLGKPIAETFYFNPEDRGEFLKQLHEKGSVTNFEVILKRKDDSPVIVETNSHFYYDEEGSFTGVEGVFRDITERKIAEEHIKKSIKEKENLLKEIHHRVKNNLQIISSLLNLQEDYVKEDPTACHVLKESQNRVTSMAMIHEMIYQSDNLTDIKLDEYIQSLVSNLFYTYNIVKDQIKPLVEVEDVKLNMETAVPCGLIISELVSNSLKHAFPNRKEGQVCILLKELNQEFELVISDNGIGFPEDLDFKNTDSLGLHLVNSLIGQIDGEIELDRSHGTKFIITFKELEYKKRL